MLHHYAKFYCQLYAFCEKIRRRRCRFGRTRKCRCLVSVVWYVSTSFLALFPEVESPCVDESIFLSRQSLVDRSVDNHKLPRPVARSQKLVCERVHLSELPSMSKVASLASVHRSSSSVKDRQGSEDKQLERLLSVVFDFTASSF